MSHRLAWARSLAAAAVLSWTPLLAAADDAVVAKVDGQEIRQSDLEEARDRLPAQLRGLPAEALRPLLIGSLIDTRLLAAEARRANLRDDPEFKRRMTGLEDRVLERLFLERQIAVRATDAVLRERYDARIAARNGLTEVRARHILTDSEEKAREMLARLKDGADFAELARANSSGPSAGRGGDLGYFTEDQMVPEVARVAFSLDKGTVAEAPVRSAFGWHVIRVEDRRAAKAPSFEEAAPALREEIARELLAELVRDLRAKAAISIDGADAKPEK
jgi:peptidyl-prolyl cis-trans isomerase C